MSSTTLIIPAFFAGVLTFLAPCTLPLVPAYLGFISGASLDDLKDEKKAKKARFRIFLNGLLYVLGFTVVFVALGALSGFLGSTLVGYKLFLSRLGGLFVIFFGLFMLGFFNITFFRFLYKEGKLPVGSHLKPGTPISSLLFGLTFALGWTPCVGPILGSILLLASTSSTVGSGILLLSVFSLGLALPFLLVAFFIGSSTKYIKRLSKYLNILSFVGGLFLIFLGILIFTNRFSFWVSYAYSLFDFINYERLLDYL